MHGSFFTIMHSAWLSNRPATMGMQKAYLSYKNNKRTNSSAIVNISKLKLFGNLYKKYICAPDAHAVSLTTCEISIYIYRSKIHTCQGHLPHYTFCFHFSFLQSRIYLSRKKTPVKSEKYIVRGPISSHCRHD